MEKPCELRQRHKASEDFQNAEQFISHKLFCFKLKKNIYFRETEGGGGKR